MKSQNDYKKLLQVTLSQVQMFDEDIRSIQGMSKDNVAKSERMRDISIMQAILYAKSLNYEAGYVVRTPLSSMQPVLVASGLSDGYIEGVASTPIERGVIAYITLPSGQVHWSLYSDSVKIDKGAWKCQDSVIKAYMQEGRKPVVKNKYEGEDEYYEKR